MNKYLSYLPFERFKNPPPTIPVIRLTGIIGRGSALRPGLALRIVAGMIEKAFAAADAPAVALAINSPGGSPVQSALIARRIRELADEKKKPVLAFAEDVAASGGYWLALAADEIYADESSIVGSIGVVAAGFGFQDLIARYGIERRIYTAGRSKVLLDPFRPEKEEDVRKLEAVQREIHDTFKRYVRDRRGSRLKAGDEVLFEGDFWTGRTALDLGLIDGIGHMRPVLRSKFGDKVRLRPIGQERGWLRRRLNLNVGLDAGGGLSPGGLLGGGSTEGLAGGLAEEALAVLEERAHWLRFGL